MRTLFRLCLVLLAALPLGTLTDAPIGASLCSAQTLLGQTVAPARPLHASRASVRLALKPSTDDQDDDGDDQDCPEPSSPDALLPVPTVPAGVQAPRVSSVRPVGSLSADHARSCTQRGPPVSFQLS